MAENIDAGTLSYTVTADTAGLLAAAKATEDGTKRIAGALGNMGNAGSKAAPKLKATSAAIKGLGSASSAATDALKGLLPLIGFAGMIALAKNIVATADSYNEMTERVKMATKAGEDYEKVNQRLLDTANRTYRPLSEAAEVYITASRGLEAMGKSTSEILDITDSLSFAFVKNATSADRANSAINAFTGAVANGKVNAQQWSSIIAATPSIVTDLANATGKSEGQILKLGAAGQLTATQLVNSLQKSLESNRTAADNMKTTVGDATQAVINNIGVLVGKVNQATGSTNDLAASIAKVAEAIENADVEALAQELESIKGTIALVMDGVEYLAEKLEKNLPNAVQKTETSFTQMALSTAKEVDGIASALQGTWASIQKGAEVLTANIENYFANAWSNVKGQAAGFVNSMADILNVPLQAMGMEGFGKVSFGSEALKPIKSLSDEMSKAFESAAVGLGAYDKMLTRITDNAIDRSVNEWQQEYGEKVEVVTKKTTDLDEETKKTKKSLTESEKAAKKNQDALDSMGQALYLAGLKGEQLAKAQAVMSLNEYATPEQIKNVEDLAAEIYRVQQMMSLQEKIGEDPSKYIRGDVEPLAGGEFDQQDARYAAEVEKEEQRYADQLVRLREAMEAQKLTQDQYNAEFEAMQEQHAKRLNQIDDARTSLMLSSTRGALDDMTSALGSAFGEQSGIYKAAFAASKAFAIAESIIKIQQGIASAAALPFPANIPAMASVAAATANIVSSIQAVTMAGGRRYGGPVNPGKMYQVNETGQPEVFNAGGGKQYFIPNSRGQVIPSDQVGGMGQAPIVNVVVNGVRPDQSASVSQGVNDDKQAFVEVMLNDIETNGPITQAGRNKLGWAYRPGY